MDSLKNYSFFPEEEKKRQFKAFLQANPEIAEKLAGQFGMKRKVQASTTAPTAAPPTAPITPNPERALSALMSFVPKETPMGTNTLKEYTGTGVSAIVPRETAPVASSKEEVDSVVGILEKLKSDPAKFKQFRNTLIQQSPGTIQAMEKIYSPNYVKVLLSDAQVDSPEVIRKDALTRDIKKGSQLQALLNQQPEVDPQYMGIPDEMGGAGSMETAQRMRAYRNQLSAILAAKKEEAAGIDTTSTAEDRKKLEQITSPAYVAVQDTLAKQEAVRKEAARRAAEESPAGVANREREIVTLKKKAAMEAAAKEVSFAEKQRMKRLEDYEKLSNLLSADVEEAEMTGADFRKGLDDNEAQSVRSTKEPVEKAVDLYFRSRLTDQPEEVEKKYKDAEWRYFLSLVSGQAVDKNGKAVALTDEEKQKRILRLKNSQITGGSPSALYYAWKKFENKPATPAELKKLRDLVNQ